MLHMAIEGEIGKTTPWLFVSSGGTTSSGIDSVIHTLGLSQLHRYFAYLIQALNFVRFILSSKNLSLRDKMIGLDSLRQRYTTPPYSLWIREGFKRLINRVNGKSRRILKAWLKRFDWVKEVQSG